VAGRRWLWPTMVAVGMTLNLRTSLIALHYTRDDFSQYAMDRNIGRALAVSMRPGDWLSVLDAGMVPYFANVPTHDAVGLADGASVRRGPPYFTFVGAEVAFCRPDVAVVVVGMSDDDDETPRVLDACGFRQRVDVPISRCGAHWIAKSVFARDGVPLDAQELVSKRTFVEQCPWDFGGNGLDLGSLKTWISWDGTG
jgi:hypothetical protein